MDRSRGKSLQSYVQPNNVYAEPSPAGLSLSSECFQSGINQKLDRMITLVLEQKTVSEKLKEETSELRKEVAAIKSELSGIKQVSPSESSASSSVIKKKIPSQLSVSLRFLLLVLVTFHVCKFEWSTVLQLTVKQLHEKYDEDKQFNGSKEYVL